MVREAPLVLRKGTSLKKKKNYSYIKFWEKCNNAPPFFLLGCDKLFSLTNQHKIPILIFSGGITQLIELVIVYAHNNIYIRL